MKEIIVRETDLKECLKVYPKIKEFDRMEAGTVEFCNNKIRNADHLILSAYLDNKNVGYLIAYQKKESFHCWVAGVDPNYRKMGILTKMMNTFENYAKKQGYAKVTIKTMNNKREMLNYLVKNNWNFIEIEAKENALINEIRLEKII